MASAPAARLLSIGLLCCALPGCSDCGCGAPRARDAAADVDVDGDVDEDRDADPVPEADLAPDAAARPECDLDCDGLFDRCEVGDCSVSGAPRPCCVAAETTCRMRFTTDLHDEPLELDYRGFYDHDMECLARVLESDGAPLFVFTARHRPGRCVGVRVQRIEVVARLDEVALGAEHQLCVPGDLAHLQVAFTPGGHIGPYFNAGCSGPGSFSLSSTGGEGGDGYALRLEGPLALWLEDPEMPAETRVTLEVEGRLERIDPEP